MGKKITRVTYLVENFKDYILGPHTIRKVAIPTVSGPIIFNMVWRAWLTIFLSPPRTRMKFSISTHFCSCPRLLNSSRKLSAVFVATSLSASMLKSAQFWKRGLNYGNLFISPPSSSVSAPMTSLSGFRQISIILQRALSPHVASFFARLKACRAALISPWYHSWSPRQ